MEDEKYVIIAEHKMEGPLVCEMKLSHGSYELAYEKMRSLKDRSDIIRVCMAKLVYETGNETLLLQNKENKQWKPKQK